MTLFFCLLHAAALAAPATEPLPSEVPSVVTLSAETDYSGVLAEWE